RWSAPRRAGVSSFGFGGTNAHVIVEQPPPRAVDDVRVDRAYHVLRVTARTKAALRALAARHIEALRATSDVGDYCFSANVGRAALEERAAIVVHDRAVAVQALEALVRGEPHTSLVCGRVGRRPRIALAFGGAVESLATLRAMPEVSRAYAEVAAAVDDVGVALQIAIARTLRLWGIEPSAVLGMARGEPAAACVAGAIDERTASEIAWRDAHSTWRCPPVEAAAPRVRYVATATGAQVDRFDAAYWEHRLASAPRVADARSALDVDLVLWIGDGDGDLRVVDEPSLYACLAQLEVRGATIDWAAFYRAWRHHRVEIPTYPFQRERFWIERPHVAQSTAPNSAPRSYEVRWVPRRLETRHRSESRPWHVLGDAATARLIAEQLRTRGVNVVHDATAARTVVYAAGSDWRHDLRALLECAKRSATVHLVTRCAQPVGARPIDVGAAALWGFGRAAAIEQRSTWGKMIDLGGNDDAPSAADELLADDPEDHVTLRSGARFVARLVDGDLPVHSLPVRGDATYLVTGGTGALGLAAARGLAERGAKHVAVLARGASELTIGGCTVHPVPCDVADEHAVQRVLVELARTAPPLRGVVHAAGVLDDGIIAQQSWERFEKVLAAKAMGAWHLHRATTDLDFFIMFSSMAGVLGSPGQSSYCAANAFLDALAHERHRLGLPVLSVAWGPFDAGMARGTGVRMRRRGIEPLAIEDMMPWLDRIAGATNVGVMAADWARIAQSGAMDDVRSLLADRLAAKTGTFVKELRALPSEARGGRLADHITTQIANVMRVPSADTIDRRAGLLDLGVDSLMALELKNRLQRDLEVRLEPTLVFNHPTIERLTAYLSSLLFGEQARPASSQPSSLDSLLDHLEQLADDDARRLLEKELTP
ncbi:MAG TPA: SDR family NAD(P)-dependent oxidoreductase, partial [Kofleriaceae bacterium]